MKFVVVNVYNRKIMKVGVANTPTEATDIMKSDFMSVFLSHYEEEDFNNKLGCGDKWDFNTTAAWLNGHMQYDWKVIEVD